jgi:hypothetical protein
MQSTMHVYEVRPRKDHRAVDLISDALAFGRLWYGEPDAVSNAIGLCAIYFASLVWDSVCACHTAIAETAVRPSQGTRSRNVMTMVTLS